MSEKKKKDAAETQPPIGDTAARIASAYVNRANAVRALIESQHAEMDFNEKARIAFRNGTPMVDQDKTRTNLKSHQHDCQDAILWYTVSLGDLLAERAERLAERSRTDPHPEFEEQQQAQAFDGALTSAQLAVVRRQADMLADLLDALQPPKEPTVRIVSDVEFDRAPSRAPSPAPTPAPAPMSDAEALEEAEKRR